MSSSPTKANDALALSAEVTDDELIVALADGRTVAVPLSWYPRLSSGTQAEREDYRLIGNGAGIHWPRLDEDIAVEDLLAGRPSGESEGSAQRWRDAR